MSRNQSEGRYLGRARGQHFRTREYRRPDSWRAFREWSYRKHLKGAQHG